MRFTIKIYGGNPILIRFAEPFELIGKWLGAADSDRRFDIPWDIGRYSIHSLGHEDMREHIWYTGLNELG